MEKTKGRRKLFTLDEFQSLDAKSRYYYKNNRPELCTNLNLTEPIFINKMTIPSIKLKEEITKLNKIIEAKDNEIIKLNAQIRKLNH